MTLHEVTIAVEAIMKRKKSEMKFHAACMGATIKDDDNQIDPQELTDKQKQLISKSITEYKKRRGLICPN